MLQVWAPTGVGEVGEGEDLAGLLLQALGSTGRSLREGDIVLVTSKVVSKAEGRSRRSTRDEELPGETARVVATRGPTRIVRNRLGLTMAAAGIDASNVTEGTVLLLPEDPDGTARRLRATWRERTGVNVAVVITDTAGRAWRDGQTDIAIGAAGLVVLESFVGRSDGYGNPLVVTAPAVADELASAAELAQGKLGSRPFAIVSGREDLVLAADADGSGATALIRAEGADLFGYGAREAVVRALKGDPADRAPFGAPTDPAELLAALAELGHEAREEGQGVFVAAPVDHGGLAPVLFAFGWRISSENGIGALLSPGTP